MAEVNIINWHINPLRADRWYQVWMPAVERARVVRCDLLLADPLRGRPSPLPQTTIWEDRDDFERFWSSDEIADAREASG